jgi:hypothetical protein
MARYPNLVSAKGGLPPVARKREGWLDVDCNLSEIVPRFRYMAQAIQPMKLDFFVPSDTDNLGNHTQPRKLSATQAL